LKGAIDQVRKDEKEGKLFAVVIYNTTYKTGHGEMVKYAFALGHDVSVNTIIGLPALRSMKGILDVVNGRFDCGAIGVSFTVDYKEPERWSGKASWFSIEIMEDAAQAGNGNESILVDEKEMRSGMKEEKSCDNENETSVNSDERVVSFVGEKAFQSDDSRIDTAALQSIAELGVASLDNCQDFRIARN
jgi:hypothetical protein